MEVFNYFVWLLVLIFCSIAVARKGSHGNRQLLQRLETLEGYQRFSNNKVTKLEHDFNTQTAIIEEQKKVTINLEATVRQLTATMERTNRLARRNRRQYLLIKSFVTKKTLKEWTAVMDTNFNKQTHLSPNHNHRNNIPNHHKDTNNNNNNKYSQDRKLNKLNGHQHHDHTLSTSHQNKNNHKPSNGNFHKHNPHVSHKSNTTNTKLHSNDHHHKSDDDSSSHGHSHQHDHKTDHNKNNGNSNHRNKNKSNQNHQHNGNNRNNKHHITATTNAHTNKGKAVFTKGHSLLVSDSISRHRNRSFDQQGHTKPTRINSNKLDDTHDGKHQHNKPLHSSDEKETHHNNQKQRYENQETRHLQSNETPERRRNLKAPRQEFGGIAFSVYLDHDATIGQHETVKFNKIITNDGGGYDASSGIFTCSEAGVYMLTFSIGQRDQDHYMWAELMLNSKNLIDAVVDTYHPYQDLQGGNTVIVRLNQGDRVWIDATHNGSHLEGSGSLRLTTFSGLYLYS